VSRRDLTHTHARLADFRLPSKMFVNHEMCLHVEPKESGWTFKKQLIIL